MASSVLAPVLYMIIVFGAFGVFAYRRNATVKALPPYFPTHAERNTYVTLLQKTDPPASDPLLKSALLRRAMADVQRVLRLREDKPALQNLLQKGSIGDDLWNSLLAAEKELEAEIMEVVAEANTFAQGWGQVIFPTANEMIANEKMRALYETSEEARQALALKNTSQPTPLSLPVPSGATSDTESVTSPSTPSKKNKKRR